MSSPKLVLFNIGDLLGGGGFYTKYEMTLLLLNLIKKCQCI